MSNQTIDDAVALIKQVGKGALLSKTDIEHGYRNKPIHPEGYGLLGFALGNEIYYDETFLMLFIGVVNNKLLIAGCVHLLDDFLLVVPPPPPPLAECL